MTRSPFPLDWPVGAPRKRWRDNSDFDKSRGFNAARDGVLDQLRLFKASHVVITSNLPTNGKGLPHSASVGQLDDPGIAVYWVKAGKEHVIACDRWRTCMENMRAIEKTLEALRGIARWGSTEMVEQAFAGFAALPPGSGTNAYTAPEQSRPKTWREIFGVNIEPWASLPLPDLLAIVKSRHREQIKEAHPDKPGGSLELTQQLNAALASAELELK
jgi:hypothetical protein